MLQKATEPQNLDTATIEPACTMHTPVAAMDTSVVPHTSMAVDINAIMLAWQTAHLLMLMLGWTAARDDMR
jgi:hypothetical protein